MEKEPWDFREGARLWGWGGMRDGESGITLEGRVGGMGKVLRLDICGGVYSISKKVERPREHKVCEHLRQLSLATVYGERGG